LAAGFFGGHAGAKVVFDVEFEVGGELVLQLTVELLFAEEIAEAE
jgi:hypothetical protein